MEIIFIISQRKGVSYGYERMVTAKEAEVEQVIKGKLMEDLRAVVAGAEELLKATADRPGSGSRRREARRRNR